MVICPAPRFANFQKKPSTQKFTSAYQIWKSIPKPERLQTPHESISLYQKHQKHQKSLLQRNIHRRLRITATITTAQFPDVSKSASIIPAAQTTHSNSFEYLSDIEVYHNVRILEYGININYPLRGTAQNCLHPTSEHFEVHSFLVRSGFFANQILRSHFLCYVATLYYNFIYRRLIKKQKKSSNQVRKVMA